MEAREGMRAKRKRCRCIGGDFEYGKWLVSSIDAWAKFVWDRAAPPRGLIPNSYLVYQMSKIYGPSGTEICLVDNYRAATILDSGYFARKKK